MILEHVGPRGRHWDLMLECGPSLRTWSLAAAPEADGPIAAEALADHRKEYLDYEGPISGGRGTVARWDHGTYELLEQCAGQVLVKLSGRRLQGQATLRLAPRGAWEFCLRP